MCPLCPSDISPASGGNLAARPLQGIPCDLASLARVPLRFAKGKSSPCPLLKEGVEKGRASPARFASRPLTLKRRGRLPLLSSTLGFPFCGNDGV